jgi:GT2 family glycosyltransferase/peptidoglycan/xylan/chitin deacetylase (PgdA/CDA1 family)
MNIPIIIVSYSNPMDVVRCLEALRVSTADPPFDVYLCENGGTAAFDALVCLLHNGHGPCTADTALMPLSEEMPRFARVKRFHLRGRDASVVAAEARENYGYAGAINAWLRVLLSKPAGPGIWILNPDTRPDAFALAELVASSRLRGKGMVGSRVVSFDEPNVVHTRGLRWRPIRASTAAVDFRTPAAIEPNHDEVEARLDAPSGTSIYVTRQCLELIGFMDERYFLYFEDLDWGYRAKKFCGVGYAHRSVVPHQGGTTIGSARSRSEASPLSVYLEFRNRLLFVRRHHRSWTTWTLAVLIVRSLEYGTVGAFDNMCVALRGLKAGLAGETGRPDCIFNFDGGAPRFRERQTLARTGTICQSPHDRQGATRAFGSTVTAATKRKAKIGISLAFFLIAVVWRFLGRVLGRPARHRLVILYYHAVPQRFRARFARQLDIVAASATVVLADYRGAAVSGGHSVAITFDDAFMSVLDNALPELHTRRLPATIFVPTGSLGRSPGWEMEDESSDKDEVVATADALRTLNSDLLQLGAHSLTHPHLPRVPSQDALREIAGCREQMRDIFGIDIRCFAFPYGDYDAATVELCREAGYERVFTNVPSPVDPASDAYLRGRVLVDPSDGALEFYLKMSGAYEWMAYFSAAKKWFSNREWTSAFRGTASS